MNYTCVFLAVSVASLTITCEKQLCGKVDRLKQSKPKKNNNGKQIFNKNRIYPFQMSPQLLFSKIIKNLLCYTENVEVCTNGMNSIICHLVVFNSMD